MMKRLIVPICVLLISSTSALAQTRSRTTRRGTQSSKTAKASAPAAADVMNGATKVADQIKNLTKFLYILGGVAKGIEEIDAAAKSGQASPAALQQNTQNKSVVNSRLEKVLAA